MKRNLLVSCEKLFCGCDAVLTCRCQYAGATERASHLSPGADALAPRGSDVSRRLERPLKRCTNIISPPDRAGVAREGAERPPFSLCY